MPKLSTASGEKKFANEIKKETPSDESVSEDACTDAQRIWKNFLDLLSDSLKASEINTWFSVIVPKSFEGNVLTVSVPSEDFYSLIESRYNKVINSIVETLLGENGKLHYEIIQMGLFDSGTGQDTQQPHASILPISSRKMNLDTPNRDDAFGDDFETNLNQKHFFDNFIKGESNELAIAAAYAITNNPGHTYNPFFVYGGVGLGKTHLIQAIGNEILKKFPDKKIYYTTAPDFTTQFTNNIAQSRLDFSSNKNGAKKLDFFYKSLDVLIIDDIQYLSGKEKTQDFMYQIFNSLYDQKKHIIFSSDKPVSQIKGIEERLISRFQWGITADIQPPNWEMRVAIIQKKFEEAKIDAPEEVVHFIASNVKDSIRTIEGCIVGIIADSVLRFKGEINLNIAENVISRVIGIARRSRNVSIESIICTVAEYYKISENQILSRKRTKEVAFARQVAMYLAKDLTNLTLETIGLNFGGKDHATVLYAYNTINSSVKKDGAVSLQIEEIKELLRNL